MKKDRKLWRIVHAWHRFMGKFWKGFQALKSGVSSHFPMLMGFIVETVWFKLLKQTGRVVIQRTCFFSLYWEGHLCRTFWGEIEIVSIISLSSFFLPPCHFFFFLSLSDICWGPAMYQELSIYRSVQWIKGFPCDSAGKESSCNVGDLGLIPGLGRSPGEGKGCQLQYFGLTFTFTFQWINMENSRIKDI